MAPLDTFSSEFLFRANLVLAARKMPDPAESVQRRREDDMHMDVQDVSNSFGVSRRILRVASPSQTLETLDLDHEMRHPSMAGLKRDGIQVPADELSFCAFVRPPLRMGFNYYRDGKPRTMQLEFYHESDCVSLVTLLKTIGLPVRAAVASRPLSSSRPMSNPRALTTESRNSQESISQLSSSQRPPYPLPDMAPVPRLRTPHSSHGHLPGAQDSNLDLLPMPMPIPTAPREGLPDHSSSVLYAASRSSACTFAGRRSGPRDPETKAGVERFVDSNASEQQTRGQVE
ncbi:MAG: hypothetical protein M1838_002271 [Thelocarpon superellum]|nr:MAG: hypothetical protein M1838_002271 [Thelocarpon superellum]